MEEKTDEKINEWRLQNPPVEAAWATGIEDGPDVHRRR